MQSSDKTKSHRKLLESAGLVGFLTLISRVAGMLRDIASARVFGTSGVWDAFLYAFTIPNFLRGIVGEGALSRAFIPVYSEILREKGKEEADRVANIVFTLLSIFLAAVLVVCMLSFQAALAFIPMPEKLRLTLQFLGILFPYIFFLAHVALSMGMLHCRNHFFTPAMSPVVLNIIWLAAVVFVCPFGKTLEAKAFLLAGCILFSGVIQFAIQLFPLYRFGYRLKLVFDFFHPALKKMARLMGPAILTFAVTQISVLLDMTFAFFLGDGANASLYYGNRLMQFPLGLFGIAVGTVLLPTFSNQAANFGELRQTLSFSLRSVFFIIVPASVGLIFLRDPIVRVLFERGNFDEVSTIRTATTLMCYSFGLFAYAGQKAVTSTFYALQDSKTPFLISGFSLGLDLILNLILMWPLKEAGLALSTSIGGIVDFLLLFYLLEKKIEKLERESIIASLARITAASLVMGIGAWLAYRHAPLPFSSGLLSEIFRLACGIASGILLYLVSAYFFRVNELHGILKALRR